SRLMHTAPAELASRPAASQGNFHRRAARIPARNASPAPVESTCLTRKAGTLMAVSGAAMTQPRSPIVIITARLPYLARIFSAILSGSLLFVSARLAATALEGLRIVA